MAILKVGDKVKYTGRGSSYFHYGEEYTITKIDKNKKSIAYSLTFNDSTRTLTDEEVTEIFNNIIKEVEKKYNATLRDN